MMNNVYLISLIGAGFVILGLMLLWFLMEGLVRLTAGKTSAQKTQSDTNSATEEVTDYKLKAAAAATAVSIALLKSSFVQSEQKMGQGLTAWQSANRQRQVYNRPRGGLTKRNCE